MRLSRRQTQIVELIADCYSGKEIARTLNVSPKTVESHVQRLFDRCGVRNRAGLVAKWMTKAA
ncbi:response regulator transcription factor [Streptomyces sp. NPDC056161]|uniref:response regulator transcription factor n=1 Tax=Streptomyces sp. NPDC056161 TaxID=3345732 RepID=UPI0035D5DBC0